MRICDYLNNLMEISTINLMNRNQKIIDTEPPSMRMSPVVDLYSITMAYKGIYMYEYINENIKVKSAKSKYACLNIYTKFLNEEKLFLRMIYAEDLLIANTVNIMMV